MTTKFHTGILQLFSVYIKGTIRQPLNLSFFVIFVDRYKYKFLRATTSNIPSSVIKDNRGSKLTIGRGGMLKVQHLVSVGRPSISHAQIDSVGYQQPSRIAFIEFFLSPEEDDGPTND